MTKEEYEKQYGGFETEDENEAKQLAAQLNKSRGVLTEKGWEKVIPVWSGSCWILMLESNYHYAVENELL